MGDIPKCAKKIWGGVASGDMQPPSAEAQDSVTGADPPPSSFLDRVDGLAVCNVAPTTPSLIALMGDHNEAYRYWRQAREEDPGLRGAVLVHFDSHDDLGDDPPLHPLPPAPGSESEFLSYVSRTPIGGFIAPAVYEGLVDEIYWVVPDWEEGFDVMEFIWFGAERVFLTGKVADNEGEKLWFSDRPPPPASGVVPLEPLRRVPVHLRTKETLPDFEGEARPVILDIDEDGIAYTGYGTTADRTQSVPSEEIARKRAHDLIDTFQAKHLDPAVTTIAGSPEYTPTALMGDIAEALVDGISAWKGRLRFAFGTPSPSLNTAFLARAIAGVVGDNFRSHPLLRGGRGDIVSFDKELLSWTMRSVDERGHFARGCDEERTERNGIVNRCLPEVNPEERQDFVTRRGDYDAFIERCEEYGLTRLASSLAALAALQSDAQASPDALKHAFERVLMMCRRLRLK